MYLVKQQNDKTVGVYDTERGCYPIETPELRAAGVKRIEGSGPRGWFKGKADIEEAQRIADTLNKYHGHAKEALQVVAEAAEQVEDDLQGMADSLIADQAG